LNKNKTWYSNQIYITFQHSPQAATRIFLLLLFHTVKAAANGSSWMHLVHSQVKQDAHHLEQKVKFKKACTLPL
jgi:hypothetical protein